MVFKRVFGDKLFRYTATADALSYRLGAVFKQCAIGAGLRHPADFIHVLRCEFQTGRHQCATFVITSAGAGVLVKVFADNIGVVDVIGVIILQFYQAAFAAVIANGFPFFRGVVAKIFGHFFFRSKKRLHASEVVSIKTENKLRAQKLIIIIKYLMMNLADLVR